jgi:hypothetical protein
MAYALEYALAHNYDYCFFFEDDSQFLWFKEDYPDYVENLFYQCTDAIQIQPLFLRRIVWYPSQMEYLQSAHAYRTSRGFTTTGIWNLERVGKHADYKFICHYLGSNLRYNSAYWLERGYRVYYQGDPTVAIIPWVYSQLSGPEYKSNSSRKCVGEKSSDYVLKPLDEKHIRLLKLRDPRIPPFQEYLEINAEFPNRPIWHQKGKNLIRYYYLCHDVVSRERRTRQSPGRVRVLSDWQPTTIAPEISHVNEALWQEMQAKKIKARRKSFFGRIRESLKKIFLKYGIMQKALQNIFPLYQVLFVHYLLSYKILSHKIIKEKQQFMDGEFLL